MYAEKNQTSRLPKVVSNKQRIRDVKEDSIKIKTVKEACEKI
jgi:hypothetical protein